MFHRVLSPSSSRSFFLFGARGTGKSTFLREQWDRKHHYINLLLDRWERRYQQDPDLLISDLQALAEKPTWVVIDEIQKVPKLLDVVHELIESTKIKFVLTGSSARKLKRRSSNLLAGRAFHNNLFPLTHLEIGQEFDLSFVLNWGALPNIFSLNPPDRRDYLSAYCQSYLKEEILQEQIVRNGAAFRSFLEIAAQENGKTLNFSKIARDVGIDTKTVQSFFQILEDTLIGRMILAYHRSTRKSVKHQPKFYIFDLGIKRAMGAELGSPLIPRTSAYGNAFEHFLIMECERLNSYYKKDYQLSHYQTTAGGEIDLILHRGRDIIAVEIKSAMLIDSIEIKKLEQVAKPLRPTQVFYVSQDPTPSKHGTVSCLHWRDFLHQIFIE